MRALPFDKTHQVASSAGDDAFTSAVEQLCARKATLGEVTQVLCAPALQALSDEWLDADPGFSRLFRMGWNPPARPLGDLRALPEGTFGRVYVHFMEHYQLQPNFFPLGSTSDKTPTEYAALRLSRTHDYWHVLAAYETSDREEVRVQSFTFGQAPGALARLLFGAYTASSISAPTYKHLRDIREGALIPEEISRGCEARGLLAVPIEDAFDVPLDRLRMELNIVARSACPSDGELLNTCGAATSVPFFQSS